MRGDISQVRSLLTVLPTEATTPPSLPRYCQPVIPRLHDDVHGGRGGHLQAVQALQGEQRACEDQGSCR